MRGTSLISKCLEVRLTPRPNLCMSRSRRWRTHTAGRKEIRALATQMKGASMEEQADYKAWSHEKLIERVTLLEAALKAKNSSLTRSSTPPPKKTYKKPRSERVFDPSKYNTRLVAFKLAYLGKRYNGYEYHTGNATPLPTIEEELWQAFNKARLIFPVGPDGKQVNPTEPGEINWEGCDYSKCGRTDKGVSAFGQVIGIRVRSNRPLEKKKEEKVQGNEKDLSESPQVHDTGPDGGFSDSDQDTPDFDPILDELPYCSLLNRLLPPDIRILAWCPAPPAGFSARFSCRERQYRYFFTQPAFAPTPSHLEFAGGKKVKDGWLDISAMREAAKLYEGQHDFRNFCKVDGGKQITNFERRIFKADIEEVSSDRTSALSFVNGTSLAPAGSEGEACPKVYTFTLHGSAFLWHQVRCMVSVLFLVAQGLEKPSIITELLDVASNPRRPTYEMASDTPLVLWNCLFPKEDDTTRSESLDWIYVGDTPGTGDNKYGTASLLENLWQVWRERKTDEMLAGTLISVVAAQGKDVEALSLGREKKASRSQRVFDGSDLPRLQGTYTPIMKKPKMDSVDDINEKYALRKGFESSADMRLQGFRRMNKPAEGGPDNVTGVEAVVKEEQSLSLVMRSDYHAGTAPTGGPRSTIPDR